MSNRASKNLLFEQSTRTVHLIAGHVSSPTSISQTSISLPVVAAERSPYLGARLRSASVHGDSIIVELPNVDPAALRLYAWWLQFENAPLFLHGDKGPLAQPRHTLIWRECFDLIQAHSLGSKFGDADFRQYILGQLDAWLDPQQDPDLELLDYLWEKDRDVSDELLCFVMGHMLQMEMKRAGLLVGWMKRLIGGRRMMDYIEGMRESGRRGTAVSATKSFKSRESSSGKLERVERGVATTKREDSPAVEDVVVSEPASRDRTPPSFYRKRRVEVPTFDGCIQQDREGAIATAAPENRRSQRGNTAHVPRPATFAVPKRKPTQRTITPQGHLEQLPQALRIHPKALASIVNANIHAEMERQSTSNPKFPPLPSLHPSIREALHSTLKPTRSRNVGRTPKEDPPEMRGGAHSASLARKTATMPDASLSLLDFWTDPSPSDLPGPDFWADLPATPALKSRRSKNLSTVAPHPKPQPQWTQNNLSLSPTTKQIIQSFSLTSTPTPRRHATRSWSVASIRPSSDYHAYSAYSSYRRTAIDRPGRGIISRKPVPEEGLRFLRGYRDGERLVRVASVNSRPGRVGLGREGEMDGGEEVWMGWQGRPGTA
ncbi:hypothetical protein P171DRAFT_494986 [Karstenula rhodostoma CBS 690.94]|uniref:Uncharacterized protein n=1 Tax=Karstenula rhodostoma CBS 690.94 TaxID=1392251 RepID=A0A9P4PE04_9PLEO|nr:hypothetical protein P171DRAFT_494986 [Karstenula rhodostoma CBS 690.94]